MVLALVLRGSINKLLAQPDFAGLTGRETRMREEAAGIFSTLSSSGTDSYDDPKVRAPISSYTMMLNLYRVI